MIGSLSVSVSGLRAAETRLSIAASNIANIGSAGHTAKGAAEAGDGAKEPFQPSAAISYSVGGGVVVTSRAVDPATVSVFSPGNSFADSGGLVAFPNISLVEQMVELKLAALSYKANAKVIEIQSDLIGTLLDSFS